MHVTRFQVATAFLVTGVFAASTAEAHVSIASGPAFANKSQKITFSVGHGCGAFDTSAIRVDIPAGVTSVRALSSDFGKPAVTKTGTAVTSITWTKPAADIQTEDVGFYEITLRARIADVPFTKIQFNVTQTCRDTVNNIDIVVPWDQPPGSTTGEPAPLLTVVPARIPGWNKYVIGATGVVVADLPTYFADAQIAWRGNAAYSSNANTMTLIGSTAGVTALAGDLVTNDEIWVRY